MDVKILKQQDDCSKTPVYPGFFISHYHVKAIFHPYFSMAHHIFFAM